MNDTDENSLSRRDPVSSPDLGSAGRTSRHAPPAGSPSPASSRAEARAAVDEARATPAEARAALGRLADLLAREHAALVDFLLALADFEARNLHRALGRDTLFDFLHHDLGLSRGAAHYRKVAARLVRRCPEVADALRDGRLCLSSVLELARVSDDSNRTEVLPRFFHRSRQEARAVAAELRPAAVVPRRTVVTAEAPPAPREPGIHAPTGSGPVPGLGPPLHPRPTDVIPGTCAVHPGEREPGSHSAGAVRGLSPAAGAPGSSGATRPAPGPRPLDVAPLTATLSRIHLTVSREFLAMLRRAKAGQSRVQPGATDEQVLMEGLKLLLEKQEKRKACVPAKVKRAVLARDQARCQWPTHDGGICGATVNLEIDHVTPRARGGTDAASNCRVLCRGHNLQAAREAFGDAHMDRFAPRAASPGAASPGRTSPDGATERDGEPRDPVVRETAAVYGVPRRGPCERVPHDPARQAVPGRVVRSGAGSGARTGAGPPARATARPAGRPAGAPRGTG